MKTLREFDFQNKRVLVRCDFNVPLDKEGNILDDFRIKQAIPTINYLKERSAKIILMSHLGDPDGKIIDFLNLNQVQKKLIEYLKFPVTKSIDCVGTEVESQVAKMKEGEILLLENLRFHKEEEENDQIFAKSLANLGDIYINEAFSCSHRKHASIVGIPEYVPAAPGILFCKEINILTVILRNPKRPLVAIIGGKKVETKSKLINNLSESADWILVSGLIAKEAEEKKLKFDYPGKIIFPSGDLGSPDINQESIERFNKKIGAAKTVFWNGPFGMTEKEEFSTGTKEIAMAVIRSGAFSVVGGGETIEFINKLGLHDKFNHVSTGGGAMLAFLSGEKLPGIEALK